jgi:hypothetical protein
MLNLTLTSQDQIRYTVCLEMFVIRVDMLEYSNFDF